MSTQPLTDEVVMSQPPPDIVQPVQVVAMPQTLGATSRRVRTARPMAVVEIASAIVGAAMTRILDNEGDVKWELDQLQGLKNPWNNAAYAGSPPYQTTTINVPGPHRATNWSDLWGNSIFADAELTFQHNGRALGNIQVTVTDTGDVGAYALTLKEQIMDEANAFTAPGYTDPFG